MLFLCSVASRSQSTLSHLRGDFPRYCTMLIIPTGGDEMTDVHIPDYLPDWIREHVNLYLQDGEAGHYWDASLGGGEGMLTTRSTRSHGWQRARNGSASGN